MAVTVATHGRSSLDSPPLNPLTHFLDPSISSFSDDVGEEKDTQVSALAQEQLIPDQRSSIINERAVIRYFHDGTKQPVIVGQSEHSAEPCVDVSLLLDVTTGCGGKIWPAAQVLGAYLTSKRAELAQRWRGKKIVELGSGTGLVGFVVAKLELQTETWITDQDAMLKLMAQNLELNPEGDPCYVAELEWGRPLPSDVPQKPDILLLADCVYLEVAFQPLVDTMKDLSSETTEILFCYMKRRKADKRFFTLLKKHFTFTDVADDDPERTEAYRREGLRLYSMKLRPASK